MSIAKSITDTVKELKNIRGVRINHHLRRDEIAIFEEHFRRDSFDESHVTFYRDNRTKGILGIEETGDLSGMHSFRYAYLSSDGHLLPDAECAGRVISSRHKLRHCYEKLTEGLESLGLTT